MKLQLRRFLCPDRLRSKPTLPLSSHLPAQPTVAVRYSASNCQHTFSTSGPAWTKKFTLLSIELLAHSSPAAPRTLIYNARTVAHQLRAQSLLTPRTSTCKRTYRTTSPLTPEHILIEASFFYPSVVAATIVAALFIASIWTSGDHTDSNPEQYVEIMALEMLPGRPGNLTADQEDKLRKLWAAIFQLTGVADEDNSTPSDSTSTKDKEEVNAAEGDGPKKKRFGVFRRKGDKGDAKSGTSTPTSTEPKDGVEDDKYGQTKQYYETLAKETPESIRATIWSMVKHDHPDALVLRFLRARKWDVEKALVMLVSTMNWRHSEMGVDDDIMKNGDGAAIEDEKTDSSTAQISKDVMAQLRMGKSFLHGVDKNGRPICVVRVRLHKQGEQCEPSLERYTVYIIETARMVLEPPVDTAVSGHP